MIARLLFIFALLGFTAATQGVANAADNKAWLDASYGVYIHIAVSSTARPGILSDKLVSQINRLVRRNLYPFWKCKIAAHSGNEATTLLRRLATLDKVETGFEAGADKTLFLTIKATAGGIQLACREQDMLTERWTPVVTREVRQELILAQSCFELLCETFSPRALVQIDPQNDDRVSLTFRGGALLSDVNKNLLVSARNVFLPYLVRSSRSGAPSGKVIEVPWTYLVTEELEGHSWEAVVFSGTRRPFGARRRAGIDVVALELKPVAGTTVVRFHAGHDPKQALAGYEVFEKLANGAEFQPAGFTGANGEIVVRRGDFPVTLLALRAESQPLVQVPVAPGAAAELQIPVADDTARLRVQEALTTFREQMVDVVARRNILMARARDQLQRGKQQQAELLLDKIDELPTRANMDRYLATLERDPASQSENPRVQAKIDRLFADSRKLMGTYLTTRELQELENEVNNRARQSQQ